MNRTLGIKVTGPFARKPTNLERIEAWLARRKDLFLPTTWEAMQVLNGPAKKAIHIPGLPPKQDPPPRLTVKQAMGSEPIAKE